MQNKTQVEKVRTGVKASGVILPLLGITWLFGLLSFNSDTIIFKYIFTIFNSLQGLMIFIFHCVLHKQVIKGFVFLFAFVYVLFTVFVFCFVVFQSWHFFAKFSQINNTFCCDNKLDTKLSPGHSYFPLGIICSRLWGSLVVEDNLRSILGITLGLAVINVGDNLWCHTHDKFVQWELKQRHCYLCCEKDAFHQASHQTSVCYS